MEQIMTAPVVPGGRNWGWTFTHTDTDGTKSRYAFTSRDPRRWVAVARGGRDPQLVHRRARRIYLLVLT